MEQEDDIKGSVLLDMVAELRMQYCRDREIERSFRNFYGAYLFSKSVNLIFKILIECPFWRDDIENDRSQMNLQNFRYNTAFSAQLYGCLESPNWGAFKSFF